MQRWLAFCWWRWPTCRPNLPSLAPEKGFCACDGLLRCAALRCAALRCPALRCAALPCPALPCPALPCLMVCCAALRCPPAAASRPAPAEEARTCQIQAGVPDRDLVPQPVQRLEEARLVGPA